MSDYTVYINDGADDVEYDIPDIYRDTDSETNSDQIKTYISSNFNIDFSNLSIDINRKGKLKRKCSNYEILDGEVTSMITDLGSVKTISKLNTSTVNYFDVATSTIITQNVSYDDARNYNSELNYQLKFGLLSDLSDGTFKKFKQDEPLSMDSNGYGCGDPNYTPENVITNALTMRYFQVKIQLHK